LGKGISKNQNSQKTKSVGGVGGRRWRCDVPHQKTAVLTFEQLIPGGRGVGNTMFGNNMQFGANTGRRALKRWGVKYKDRRVLINF